MAGLVENLIRLSNVYAAAAVLSATNRGDAAAVYGELSEIYRRAVCMLWGPR